MRLAMAEFVIGDDLLAAGLDDFELRVPIRDVGGDLQLQHRVALARVEPGIVIKTGFAVVPGADVTTQAEAEDTALGKVVKITVPDTKVTARLTDFPRTNALANCLSMRRLPDGRLFSGPFTAGVEL